MKKLSLLIAAGIAVLFLTACSGGGNTSHAMVEGDTIQMRYAQNLCMVRSENYTLALLRQPWDTTKILHRYVLVDSDKPLPKHLPEGTLIRTPLRKAVVYSAVHCSLLNNIGALNSIAGVCDLKYFMMPEIEKLCNEGTVKDLGDSMNPNIESIIDLNPDAILLSPFENSGGYGRIEKLHIPIVECADYLETSAMGRAEWMRFYGILLGKQQAADSLFAVVEQSYNELKQMVEPISYAPSVMCDLKTSSTWYAPGGNSTVAKLYSDAGASYAFSNDTHSGSLPFPFEVIFEKCQQADVWLIRYNQPTDKTYSELQREFASYAGFRAFKERNIYGCNTFRVPFYEETPFRPDWLLKDLIKIFHPSMLEDYKLKYYNKLAE